MKILWGNLVTVLFGIGLVLEIIGFLVGCADNIPFIIKFISPRYAKAKVGLQILDKSDELNVQDCGFGEIAQIVMGELRLNNPPEKLSSVSVTKIFRGNAKLAFSKKDVRKRIPVTVELSNGQKPEWDLEALTSWVNDLKSKGVFKIAVIVFLLGIAVQVISFVVDKTVSK